MGEGAAVKRLGVYLRLGRVSNLPTVCTNVLAGAVLAAVPLRAGRVVVTALAMSLLYTAGMFLNDAFDRRYDARDRPDRPIPAGLIAPLEVFAVGYGLLGCGIALVASTALWPAIGLSAAIVAYDAWHKTNPLSPALMALCRALVYVSAAYAVGGTLRLPVAVGATVMFVYLVGLTWWAKRGGAGVGKLIAGISLVDGAAMLCGGAALLALIGIGGYVATLRLQRRVRGT
jgi:4-hydroxybenzoate polyprenyltransferase